MSAADPLLLVAIVADHERPMIVAAAEQLTAAIAGAAEKPWPIRVRFLSPADPLPAAGAVIITSLSIDLAGDWTAERRSAYWQSLTNRPGGGRVFLCTLFRHVADRRAFPALVERIRRLDLFAVRLSREADVMLIDLDRLFALHGTRVLAGGGAARLGGRAVAEAIIADGLDDHLAPMILQRAAKELSRLQKTPEANSETQ